MTLSYPKVALITGGARRIGAVISETLHQSGLNVVIHCHQSFDAAHALCQKLNAKRANSAIVVRQNLLAPQMALTLLQETLKPWGRLDLLVNNASSFYPTPLEEVNDTQWEDLLGTNLKAPFFLAQAAKEALEKTAGVILNIIDIHSQRPLKNYPIYCTAKAGLVMMTKALAKELAPHIRVNGIAPGAILWPEAENNLKKEDKENILQEILLKRAGHPSDIAETVLFLFQQGYITGQVIAVDGGRSVNF